MLVGVEFRGHVHIDRVINFKECHELKVSGQGKCSRMGCCPTGTYCLLSDFSSSENLVTLTKRLVMTNDEENNSQHEQDTAPAVATHMQIAGMPLNFCLSRSSSYSMHAYYENIQCRAMRPWKY